MVYEESAIMISSLKQYEKKRKRGKTKLGRQYKDVVAGLGSVKNQIVKQTYARYCQIFAFVLTALCIMGGVIGMAIMLDATNKQIKEEYVLPMEKLRPALPKIEKTVGTISGIVGGLDKGISIFRNATGGLSDVLDAIKNNDTSDTIQGLFNDATSAFQNSINSVQDTAKGVGNLDLSSSSG